MTTVCVTGATDGIGLASAAALVERGHRVLVHARSPERGEEALARLADGAGEAVVVTGDLASLEQVHALAEQVRVACDGALDALVHNAGVWRRGSTPLVTQDGLATTAAVNVVAPHLLTALLVEPLVAAAPSRLVWVGSGMVGSGRVDPSTLADEAGEPDARRAYADSKAADVALAVGWSRRLADAGVTSLALDPGWVRTKLASAGAPGDVADSVPTVLRCVLDDDLHGRGGTYWKGARETRVPGRLRDTGLVDALLAAADRRAGVTPFAGAG